MLWWRGAFAYNGVRSLPGAGGGPAADGHRIDGLRWDNGIFPVARALLGSLIHPALFRPCRKIGCEKQNHDAAFRFLWTGGPAGVGLENRHGDGDARHHLGDARHRSKGRVRAVSCGCVSCNRVLMLVLTDCA